MSAAAVAAIHRCYAIIGMDASAMRHQWARKLGESWRVTLRRRRDLLTKVSAHLSGQYCEWDELSAGTREALNGTAE